MNFSEEFQKIFDKYVTDTPEKTKDGGVTFQGAIDEKKEFYLRLFLKNGLPSLRLLRNFSPKEGRPFLRQLATFGQYTARGLGNDYPFLQVSTTTEGGTSPFMFTFDIGSDGFDPQSLITAAKLFASLYTDIIELYERALCETAAT